MSIVFYCLVQILTNLYFSSNYKIEVKIFLFILIYDVAGRSLVSSVLEKRF
uniref:Uncharacterized protein n=1 Tax=Ciona intestinalis TaxID=7719 RepID=H2Y0V0_CIOIN